jgi:hypothetical protein
MPASRRPIRRLQWLDGLMLTASVLAGVLWLWLTGILEYTLPDSLTGDWFSLLYWSILPTVAVIADPFLATATLAWLAIRFRGPRPPWRRLVRQPGVAVGLVAILAWLAGAAVTLRWGADVHHGTPGGIAFAYVHLGSSTLLGSFGVLAAWTGLALEARWKPERSGVDRIGRALGVGWIALGVPSAVMLMVLIGPYY